MTRSELIGQLRQFIMLESDPNQLQWWHRELSSLAQVAQQRADESSDSSASGAENGAPPPFVGTG